MLCALALVLCANPAYQATSPVGIPARLEEQVLAGSELVPAPADHDTPIVLRVLEVSPHGADLRYDLEYTGLEPGAFDLKDFLVRRDGSTLDGLPPLSVRIEGTLPEGQITPHDPTPADVPGFGGHRRNLIVAGVLWVCGLFAILLVGRKRDARDTGPGRRPMSLAERLRPLVERGLAGELESAERAELERTLVTFWSARLDLADKTPEEALTTLYAHPEAGALLRSLEDWLHRPTPPADLDLVTLLAPYAALPADGDPAPRPTPL